MLFSGRFLEKKKGEFERTGNRHDIAIPPPESTLLDILKESGGNVVAIGKIADIYANCGVTKKVKNPGLENLFDSTLDEIKTSWRSNSYFY